ncbi:Uncharacterized protein OS=Isosphaera pallida (strain ATCC 43644 / DSM 9630 / IS1B) GN=Isop_2424 PE=4 SV=1 [Gemmataceae bacterium]|nr:Uncharacterized protein OS=Isosphaera pallida (strain ATCC 43644 / DSM 9630 / IS1B) GN=Isop_2424 PE=4 SV=1 [Gemmataceae bacterium]VTU00994.1 Uncharacterized protein OS=Isosphaera pallida (strain ATCC 43644 / DSM 9630 / IS1B) GN=Isop_2424 PE=4 SV=1 [Gemmataceae bacterium]
MAVSLIETHDSREVTVGGQGGGIPLRFVALGSLDEVEVYAAVLLATPPYFDGFVRNQIRTTPLGGPNWRVEVQYGTTGAGGGDQPVGASGLGGESPPLPSAPETDDEPLGAGYAFDTTGGTAHITQSYKTVLSVGRGGAVPRDYQRAIGVTKDRVEGCDKYVPKFEWSRTVTRENVTTAYLKRLRDMTGTVCIAPFYGRNTGEVLYLGASGQPTQGNAHTITHRFADSKNQKTIEISDDLIIDADPANLGYAKLGWQYLWVAYDEEMEDGQVAPTPVAAYVEDIYEYTNFDRLEISGGASA